MGYKFKSSNKLTNFESGFFSVKGLNFSFSVHFFIILLIFIIFDLEIVLILGVIYMIKSFFVFFLVIFLFIVGGLYLELYLGKLKWRV